MTDKTTNPVDFATEQLAKDLSKYHVANNPFRLTPRRMSKSRRFIQRLKKLISRGR